MQWCVLLICRNKLLWKIHDLEITPRTLYIGVPCWKLFSKLTCIQVLVLNLQRNISFCSVHKRYPRASGFPFDQRHRYSCMSAFRNALFVCPEILGWIQLGTVHDLISAGIPFWLVKMSVCVWSRRSCCSFDFIVNLKSGFVHYEQIENYRSGRKMLKQVQSISIWKPLGVRSNCFQLYSANKRKAYFTDARQANSEFRFGENTRDKHCRWLFSP